MRKDGAKTIITAMVLGALAFFGNKIISNSEAVIRLQVKEKTTHELLIEIKKDVKTLIRGR